MSDSVDDIRRRMAIVRSQGKVDVAEFGQAMGRVTDWREHYKAHPWAAVMLAAFAGYAIAPKRNSKVSAASSAKAESKSEPAEAAQSFTTGALGGMIGTFASRMIKDYVTNTMRQQILNRFEQRGRAPNYPEHRR